jgi:hypothetical protein
MIRDAVVIVELDKLVNDVEAGERNAVHELGGSSPKPVDGPTGSNVIIQLPGRPKPIHGECEIAATIAVYDEPNGPIEPSVWLKMKDEHKTFFVSVIGATTKYPEIPQVVIEVDNEHARLSRAAVHDYLLAA